MSEPVDWLPDGTPYSPRFGDRYHSEHGGLDQAHRGGVSLAGQAHAGVREGTGRVGGVVVLVSHALHPAIGPGDPVRRARR